MTKNDDKLFNKAIVFGDLHLGKKNNSSVFNNDCDKFIDWMINEAKMWGAETCIFLGDWHDNRRFLNVSTLNFSLNNLEKLSNNFEKIYFLLGNHDLYYRDKRELNSIEFGRNINNIHIIDEIMTINQCAFIPWLVGEEYKSVPKIRCKYMFGHFELPHFLMNAMVEMPDKGELNHKQFKNQEYVFTGHFHKRQNKKNVWYIGNAFPHDYNDVNDTERGIMFLEWDKKPMFKQWPEQPVYKSFNLSDIIKDPGNWLDDKTYAKIISDIELTQDEIQELKNTFYNSYGCRDISISSPSLEASEDHLDSSIEFQSVDQIVIEGLRSIKDTDTTNIDYKTLIEIYNNLDNS